IGRSRMAHSARPAGAVRRPRRRGQRAAGVAEPARGDPVNAQALWYVSRATGLVSFILLSLVLVLGVTIARRGKVPGLPRFAGVGLHRNAALFAVVLLVIHIVTAVIDPFVTINWLS